MNSNLADFHETTNDINPELLYFNKLKTLQINLGNLCNQSCTHCHVNAGPSENNIMPRHVMDKIIQFIENHPKLILDITGGAPELHPDFKYFIKNTDSITLRRIVRTNLTVITENKMDWLPAFFREHNIVLVASLPCYTRDNVDTQRGAGVFDKSIKALKMLNAVGYGSAFELSLAYNPNGAFLPSSQKDLELSFRQHLSKEFGIKFSNLFTLTNAPVGKFKKALIKNDEYEEYVDLLKCSFNPDSVSEIMCRTLINIGWQGNLYNCDFNQALDLPIRHPKGHIMTIDHLEDITSKPQYIITGTHCFSCTAGAGSSCTGELTTSEQDKHQDVKHYYSTVLKSSNDLKTSACCSSESMPDYRRKIISKIHKEILDRFYGCGSPIPLCLDKSVILDIGCGTGRDVYTAACLAGEDGFVIGVDMTKEQLDVGQRHITGQMNKFNFSKTNVDFRHGNIENLLDLGIKDSSIDIVMSNCVINLSPAKHMVFAEIFRVLKPGGELYFSDIFAGRRIPENLSSDPVLYGECLGGAMYIEDFRRMLRGTGCLDYRVVSKQKIILNNKEVKEKAGMIDFYSMTIRAFKLGEMEDICENYGQMAVYLGTIPESPNSFILDNHHIFPANKSVPVCGNTADMLSRTRYGKHFKIVGDKSTHLGKFACIKDTEKETLSSGCTCC